MKCFKFTIMFLIILITFLGIWKFGWVEAKFMLFIDWLGKNTVRGAFYIVGFYIIIVVLMLP